MIVVDAFAILLVLGVAALAIAMGSDDKAKRAEMAKVREELRKALASHDKTVLQDFLTLWGDKLPKESQDRVKQRIDEIIVEENP